MLQWGILDNVRKYDPVILFLSEEGVVAVKLVVLNYIVTYLEDFYIKKFRFFYINLVLTNFVPAVAVKRRGQVLLVLTGCKACVDGTKSAKKNHWRICDVFLADFNS